jgi:thiol-disulfide isomerase/thioredoxin
VFYYSPSFLENIIPILIIKYTNNCCELGKEKYSVEKVSNQMVDFWADWCHPCKLMNPVLDQIEKEYLYFLNKKHQIKIILNFSYKINYI